MRSTPGKLLPADKIDPATVARDFLALNEIDGRSRLVRWRGDFMIYSQHAATYRSKPKDELSAELIKHLNGYYSGITKRVAGDVFEQVRAQSLIQGTVEPQTWLRQRPDDWPASEIICARNGLVSLPMFARGEADCIRPATPRFFSQWALEFVADPGAAMPTRWLGFLDELWPNDPEAIACLQEMFGYIVGGGTWLQKIFCFIGPKRSGKGTIARVLRALAGLSNCAAPTLSGLGTNFGLWPLVGKTLATISDARLSSRVDQGLVVERLLSISGEDALTIDRKMLEPVTVTLPTRILLISNELPKLGDASGAMASRMILIRFSQSFYGKENTNLTNELLAELPGIFRWAVEGLVRLQAAGRIEQPESSADLLTALEDLGSPVSAFVRDRCIIDAEYVAAVSNLFAEWQSWCESVGRKPGNQQTFGRDLRAAFPQLRSTQPRENGERYRAYQGIGIRTYETGGF